jgi:acyl-CoA thioester hydrolase
VSHRTYTHDIEVQYRDLDPRRHVNHVVYASYAEQAKGRFFADVLGTPLVDTSTVVRTLEVDYRAPVDPDETVRVTLGPVAVGESSLRIEYELSVGGEVVATARTVSVYLGEDGRPERIPDAWREPLAPYDDNTGA